MLPMLKGFEPRLYQETILATAADHNTLVVLPTGMGKTAIGFMLAVNRLKRFPGSKILMLAPTKPLAEQHMNSFRKVMDLPKERFALFTGQISPEKREELWKDAQLIFSTPQGMENDVISSRIDLGDVSLLIFDEAHRTVGDYAYVFIAKQYARKARYPRILGLTASPGSDLEKIKEVARNLHAEEIEVRTDSDPDVKPYIQDIRIEWV
ncbi:DEAD/DEAH box helicase, partial [Candidatus Woesearchaeota archaeon]|nr:DEAD/DEAH box helicase [Candidatus Woesearchaeota archaeon]